MNIQPVGDRILVKREDAPAKKSPSGIIIPDSVEKEKSNIGTILAVGPGRTNDDGELIAMSVKPGTRVVFKLSWEDKEGSKVDLGEKDEEYFLVKESDILAVIK